VTLGSPKFFRTARSEEAEAQRVPIPKTLVRLEQRAFSCECRNSIAVMFELRCSWFELFWGYYANYGFEPSQLLLTGVAVEKLASTDTILVCLCFALGVFLGFHSVDYAVAATVGFGALLRKRTSRFIFWAAAAKKNCSRTNFMRRRLKRRIPI